MSAGSALPRAAAAPADNVAPALRLASIDVGSNAIRLLVGEFDRPGVYRLIAQERLPVRLGHDVYRRGELAADMMDTAVRALQSLRRQMETLDVVRYRAVATSAVRESSNGDEFIRRVRSEANLELDVITGSEEARLVQIAARQRVPFNGKRWAIVDVGGGSVEVMVVSGKGIHWSESHTMGTVRLLEEFADTDRGVQKMRRLMAEYTSTLRLSSKKKLDDIAGLIATGGNIEAISRLLSADPGEDGVSRVSVPRLTRLAEELAELSYEERLKQFDLREDRADVIVPAAFLYERVARSLGVDVIHVPHVGLREGVLLDLAENVVEHPQHETAQDRVTYEAAVGLGRRFEFDEAHGIHVGKLALALFDQLVELHELGERDRRILLAAAVLHDIGQFISYKRHHKHSLYVLQHSEVADFSPREMLLVANVARYHRKGPPEHDHEDFVRLDADEQERVKKLAALLRLADALDREHLQRVADVSASVDDEQLLLAVHGTGDLDLERWALEKKADLFRDVFELAVVLTVTDQAER